MRALKKRPISVEPIQSYIFGYFMNSILKINKTFLNAPNMRQELRNVRFIVKCAEICTLKISFWPYKKRFCNFATPTRNVVLFFFCLFVLLLFIVKYLFLIILGFKTERVAYRATDEQLHKTFGLLFSTARIPLPPLTINIIVTQSSF